MTISCRRRDIEIAVVSALLLALELLHTRILSVVFWHHWTYIVVTLGMLGIAASGSLLAASRRLAGVETHALIRFSLYGFALSAWVGVVLVARPRVLGGLAAAAALGAVALLLSGTAGVLLSLPFAGRAAAVCIAIAPIGALLGMPFAAAVAKMQGCPNIVPVAWGLNSGLSVVGTIVAIILAMNQGFVVVGCVAGLVYGAGFLVLHRAS